jgi:L-alanine-DL-glutamate epimerase-like enolase superfamily enzyme
MIRNARNNKPAPDPDRSRRGFFGACAGVTASVASVLADPPRAAAQVAGCKPGDLPDLTVREIKIYVADNTKYRHNPNETGEIISMVTHSGHEGSYPLGNRAPMPGWLDWAKPALLGKNVVDLLPAITATSGLKASFEPVQDRPGGDAAGGGRGTWPNHYTAAAEICMWDILGKAVDRPVYKLLGGAKTRVLAYASSQAHANVEEWAAEAVRVKQEGYKAYKVHPFGLQPKTASASAAYLGHIEELRAIRKAVGDDFILAHDPIQAYNLTEALKVGRVLEDLDYAWYEDPVRTSDIEGLIELNRVLNIPLQVGEYLSAISDFATYIHRGALDSVRLIADKVGGIGGSMRVGMLADAFNMDCTPHNFGNTAEQAVHFHIELALPNAFWFEMGYPVADFDRPYYKQRLRIDKDGYVPAPTEPGLGYSIDHDALDKILKRVDR